jgi:hypothetical protein
MKLFVVCRDSEDKFKTSRWSGGLVGECDVVSPWRGVGKQNRARKEQRRERERAGDC